MGNHPRPESRTDTLWWQGLVSTSCPGLVLTGTPLRFPGQPHTFLPCLTDMFLATSAMPSLSITTGHEDWVSAGRFILLLAPGDGGQDVLTRAGVQACAPFQASATPHHTGRNTAGWLLPHLPIGGQGKETEKAEINSSLTSVHLLRVLPACQIKAPW